MNKKQKKIWGLFNSSSEKPIPLKSIDISIKIVHNVSRVLYTQIYQNIDPINLEVEFYFPISPDACFDSFEAKFKDTIIKGVVKEKEEAKKEYKNEVSQGNTAAYAEIDNDTGDIMKVMIGNIPWNTDISINYSYIQKLEVSMNKFWCFRLFSCITPRYTSNLYDYLKEDISTIANYPPISSNKSQAYQWSIKAEIQSPQPISFLESPSHKLKKNYGNENHTCHINLDSEIKQFPNKDFVLLYSNGKEGVSDYVMTPFEDGYCAMVTLFTSQDNEVLFQDAYVKLAKPKDPLEDETPTLDTVRGEYIFLIDRSGSMSGDRIVMARKSLILFLKSLPKESRFNVISFGSGSHFMHFSSVPTNDDSLEAAIKKIDNFQANMGGTEIFKVMEEIYKIPLENGYPRFIYLLTDGGVLNTFQILQLVEENSEKARVFTVGVGNGCSQELITKVASYGRGKYEFVPNPQFIHKKVISLLDASLSSCYFDFKLEADNFDAIVKSVSPNPISIPFLLDNQAATFFLFLREGAFEEGKNMSLKLKYYDSKTKGMKSVEIELSPDKAINNEFIPKLALHDMIRRFEAQIEIKPKDKNVIWMDEKEIKQTLLELSLKYGILCKSTAFFCKITSNNQSDEEMRKVHVVIPSIGSCDYESDAIGYLASGAGVSLKAKAYKSGGCCSEGGSTYQSTTYLDSPANEEMIWQKIPKEQRVCLDVILKQKFEGNWEPSDNELGFLILKNGSLSTPPNNYSITSQTIWITVLVLLWLEISCGNQKETWKLIHKKGQEWLKSQGFNYEKVKELGKSFIKDG